MRNLAETELRHVSGGAGSCPCETKDDHGKKRGHEKMRKGNNGFGNGGHDGVPGKSGKQDKTR
jgi:hypothetical protein